MTLLAPCVSCGLTVAHPDPGHDCTPPADPSELVAQAWWAGHEAGRREGAVERNEMRHDNADLARQLSDACRRRASAYDEGYDRAMQDAHYVLNRLGYLERRGDGNGNPYAALRTGVQP